MLCEATRCGKITCTLRSSLLQAVAGHICCAGVHQQQYEATCQLNLLWVVVVLSSAHMSCWSCTLKSSLLQAVAAHICYALAGVDPQQYDAASQMCLLGGNHRSNIRCYASVSAMQQTQILEWARSQGTSYKYCTVCIGRGSYHHSLTAACDRSATLQVTPLTCHAAHDGPVA